MAQKVAPPTPATAHPAAAHHLKLDARRLRLSPREKQGWERPLGMIGVSLSDIRVLGDSFIYICIYIYIFLSLVPYEVSLYPLYIYISIFGSL